MKTKYLIPFLFLPCLIGCKKDSPLSVNDLYIEGEYYNAEREMARSLEKIEQHLAELVKFIKEEREYDRALVRSFE